LDIVKEIVVPFQEIPNFASNITDVIQFSVYANLSQMWSNFKPLGFCNSLLMPQYTAFTRKPFGLKYPV
jgi:hypothetical protein